jgi:hypothetical protein
VLELSGAVLGGSVAASATAAEQERSDTEIRGWVLEDKQSEVADRVGVVEEFQHRGMNLCNDGKVYRCRTCEDFEFHLLVTRGALVPKAGDVYRFESTGRESGCGNFQVRLLESPACEDVDGLSRETSKGDAETTSGIEREPTVDTEEPSTASTSDLDTESEPGDTDGPTRSATETRRRPTTGSTETDPATVEAAPESEEDVATGSIAPPTQLDPDTANETNETG